MVTKTFFEPQTFCFFFAHGSTLVGPTTIGFDETEHLCERPRKVVKGVIFGHFQTFLSKKGKTPPVAHNGSCKHLFTVTDGVPVSKSTDKSPYSLEH